MRRKRIRATEMVQKNRNETLKGNTSQGLMQAFRRCLMVFLQTPMARYTLTTFPRLHLQLLIVLRALQHQYMSTPLSLQHHNLNHRLRLFRRPTCTHPLPSPLLTLNLTLLAIILKAPSHRTLDHFRQCRITHLPLQTSISCLLLMAVWRINLLPRTRLTILTHVYNITSHHLLTIHRPRTWEPHMPIRSPHLFIPRIQTRASWPTVHLNRSIHRIRMSIHGMHVAILHRIDQHLLATPKTDRSVPGRGTGHRVIRK